MKVFYSHEVEKFIKKLNVQESARLDRTRKFFEEYGFLIGPKYIKKISRAGVWELRAGNIRLFLGVKGNSAFGIHIIRKKSQKLSKNDIRIAEKRVTQI
jgi:phage-related protein